MYASKDRERINEKLQILCKFNNVSGSNNTYDTNIIEKLLLTTADIGEIYLTDHLYDGQVTNQINQSNNGPRKSGPVSIDQKDVSIQSEDDLNQFQLFCGNSLFVSEVPNRSITKNENNLHSNMSENPESSMGLAESIPRESSDFHPGYSMDTMKTGPDSSIEMIHKSISDEEISSSCESESMDDCEGYLK